MDKIDAMVGGMLGLGLGDAAAWPLAGAPNTNFQTACQQHFEVTKKPSWLHGALTSWTVMNLDSMLYRPRGRKYIDDLAMRVHLLVAPQNGDALRGNAPAAKNILRQAWKNLCNGDDPRLAGEKEPRADLLASGLPWSFAVDNSESQVLEAVLDSGMLISRNPRTLACGAFYVGTARTILADPKTPLADLFAAGNHFAQLALNQLQNDKVGTLSDTIDNARTILQVEMAIAQSQDWETLLPTGGIDIRLAPEKALGLALAFSQINPNQVLNGLKTIVENGGACDVIAPLAMSLFGLRNGKDHLPFALVKQVRSGVLLERRVRALFGKRPPRAEPWVYLELMLSDWHQKGIAEEELEITREENEAVPEKAISREQLALL